MFDDGVYFALEMGGALACLVRAALVRDRRPAWICIGLAILVYSLGDAFWGLEDGRSGSYTWPADVAYLLFYPLCLTGMALLLGDGRDRVAARLWVDGLIGGLTVGALAVAFAYEPVLDVSTVSTAQTALALTDRALVLDRGRIVLAAPSDRLAADSETLAALLGVEANAPPG